MSGGFDPRGTKTLAAWLATFAIALPPPSARAQAAGSEPQVAEAARSASAQLAAGIAAVEAGDYRSAVAPLSGALRGVAQDPAREGDLVRAYLHLGVAFAGLGQESPARSQFAQALLRRPEAKLEVKNAPENARRLFQEARGEAAPAIAAAEERNKKKGSKAPLFFAGAAVVGAGVGVASVAGGGSSDTAPTTFGSLEPGIIFRFSSLSGNPLLLFGSGDPASGSTIQVGTARPRFLYTAQVSTFGTPIGPFSRLQVTVDLGTLDRGSCWRTESPIFALAAGPPVEVVVDFPAAPSCAAPFTTLTVEAKLFDRDAGRQLSNSIYLGGYKVVP